jgi:uncharacterized protein
MTATGTLIVIAKEPVPGRVKTRLVPPLTHAGAAAVAAAALADTMDAVDRAAAAHRVLAFEGDPAGWRRPGWQVVAQPAGGLDTRLVAAFAAAPPDRPAVLVGMDTPQLRPEHLVPVDFAAHDACLGLATDGGYWTIGFADPRVAAAVIDGVPMSTGRTGAHQLDRLRAHGLRVQLLDVRSDVDTIDTAFEVAALAPHGRFAAALSPALANARVPAAV